MAKPHTSDPIVLSLYNGSNASGSLISAASVPASSVTQRRMPAPFDITGINLVAGKYSLKLISGTADSGSRHYFFKNGNLMVTPTAAIPESSRLVSLGLAGVIGLLVRRRRRLLWPLPSDVLMIGAGAEEIGHAPRHQTAGRGHRP